MFGELEMDSNILKKFSEIAGVNNVFTNKTDLYTHSFDAAVLNPVQPGVVVRPENSETLSKVIKLCSENSLPMTVRGAGTNLAGATIPSKDGVVILTTGMNRIIELNTEDLYAIVEPGVITQQFANEARKHDLLYPPDPGSQAVSTIGGNVAQNAGGLRGLKYGVTKDYVMGMTFFDANGDLIQSGSKTLKCVTGYNIHGLMTGSEGTLGIFKTITLKLIPKPLHRKAILAVFDSVGKASETVAAIIANRIVPATLEFMDNFTIRAVEDFSKAGLPVKSEAILLIEVDGHPAEVEDDAGKVEALCKNMGADVKMAKDDNERDKIWTARRSALSALAKVKPTLILEDATVPRSKLPDMVEALSGIAKKFDLSIGTFGHAGDGNLHPTILTDKRDKKEWKRVEAAVEEIFDKALDLGGTLSGEHGIGIAKSAFLKKELGQSTLDFMDKIKRSVDPKNLLNSH